MLTFPSDSTTCSTPAANYWSGLGELRKSSTFVQPRISTNYFFFKFQNPQLSRAWSHLRPRFHFLSVFLWHLWLLYPPPARVNTCAQCGHLTNTCTKWKIPSLTKPKGKMYKTKSLRNYIIPLLCNYLQKFGFIGMVIAFVNAHNFKSWTRLVTFFIRANAFGKGYTPLAKDKLLGRLE